MPRAPPPLAAFPPRDSCRQTFHRPPTPRNPVDPIYQLPSAERPPPHQQPFLRDSLCTDDIPGTHSAFTKAFTTEFAVLPAPIAQSNAHSRYQRTQTALYDSLAVADINGPIKHDSTMHIEHRHTNPLAPQYHHGPTNESIADRMKRSREGKLMDDATDERQWYTTDGIIGHVDGSCARASPPSRLPSECFNLNVSDISPDLSAREQAATERRERRSVFGLNMKVDDIRGAVADSKAKAKEQSMPLKWARPQTAANSTAAFPIRKPTDHNVINADTALFPSAFTVEQAKQLSARGHTPNTQSRPQTSPLTSRGETNQGGLMTHRSTSSQRESHAISTRDTATITDESSAISLQHYLIQQQEHDTQRQAETIASESVTHKSPATIRSLLERNKIICRTYYRAKTAEYKTFESPLARVVPTAPPPSSNDVVYAATLSRQLGTFANDKHWTVRSVSQQSLKLHQAAFDNRIQRAITYRESSGAVAAKKADAIQRKHDIDAVRALA